MWVRRTEIFLPTVKVILIGWQCAALVFVPRDVPGVEFFTVDFFKKNHSVIEKVAVPVDSNIVYRGGSS